MKTNPIFLAVSTLTLAAPALIHSAQGDSRSSAATDPVIQPDAPRAGLVTVIKDRPSTRRSEWRVAWKSLTALPAAERERLRGLVRAVDRSNRDRAPHSQASSALAAPRSTDGI